MNTSITRIAAAVTVLAILIPGTVRAADQPDVDDPAQLPTAGVTEVDVEDIEDFEGWTVYHWTSDGASTEALDANIDANRELGNFANELEAAASTDIKTVAAPDASTLDIDPPPPPSPGGFTCFTLVGPTELDEFDDQLETDVGQTCIGAFTEQWMGAQFERSSWTGYRNYGGTGVDDGTFQQELDVRWTAPCGGGGTYDYRLFVISYARSTDGTPVASRGYTGGSTTEACGTGF